MCRYVSKYITFLSTPSARRATQGHAGAGDPVFDFYPRPPRGGRQEAFRTIIQKVRISIHALREEGDLLREIRGGGGAISIHALREEGDPR